MAHTLGVDLDGVLADLVGFFILSEAIETKQIHNRRQFASYYFSDNLDPDIAEKWKMWLLDEVKMLQLLPYSENVYALKFMESIGWKIHIITSRQAHLETATKEWLLNKGVPFHKLFLVSDKKKYADECDYFVDDKIDNVTMSTSAKTFLMKRSWNRSYRCPAVHPINTLWELLDQKKVK